MKRARIVLLAVAVALAFASLPASADITQTMSLSVQSAAMSTDGQMVSFLKGSKFRSDTKGMGQDVSMLVDVATKQAFLLNHVARQIQVVGPQQSMAGLPMTLGEARVSVTPSGQTREILGRVCQGFDVDLSIPMTMGGETLTMRLTGPAWLTKEGPGVAEYRAVQKTMAEFGTSPSPFAQGPSAKAVAEVSKALGDAGLLMEQELRLTIEGTGALAQMMGQMGNMTMTMKTTAISTDPIPDEKFAMPEGYTKR